MIVLLQVGNYAVQIQWPDGFSQIAPYELLDSLPRLDIAARDAARQQQGQLTAAQQIMANAAGRPAASS